MLRGPTLQLISAVLLAAPRLAAQSLPASCYELEPSQPPPAVAPAHGPWLTDWPDSLAGVLDRPSYHVASRQADSVSAIVDGWWRRDSVSIEWALATVIVDPGSAADFATNAAAEYRRHSGRAGPILRRGFDLGNASRTEIALGAVSGPLASHEQALVFRLACHAAWPLIMLRHDTRYREFAWRDAGSLGWALNKQATLEQAARLLTGARRDAVLELEQLADVELAH
jgi:hypothetical protein